MLARLAASAVALIVAVLALVLAWPQLFGINDQIGIAQLVAFRAILALGALCIAVVLGLLAIIRPLRRFVAMIAIIVLVFAAANVAILAVRGFGGAQSASATDAATSVTVLSWNTYGGNPGAAAVADLALSEKADIVSLPETRGEFAVDVAERMRAGGHPMWVLNLSFSDIYDARSTAVLISPDLGDYTVASAGGTGPPGNTNVSPTVVAKPDDGDGPTIIAVHAVSPLRGEMRNWRSDLDWLATQCSGGNVIMAGDFNATLDHMAGRGTAGGDLGHCVDAAAHRSSAALGTWPSDVPLLLASPIDHVMATQQWTATSFRVITSLDSLGSDHRPIVATLTRR